MGFSTKTWRPARAASIAMGAWLPEVSTRTASTGSRSTSRQSVCTVATPYSFGAQLGGLPREVAQRGNLVAVRELAQEVQVHDLGDDARADDADAQPRRRLRHPFTPPPSTNPSRNSREETA